MNPAQGSLVFLEVTGCFGCMNLPCSLIRIICACVCNVLLISCVFHRDGYESDSEDGEGWEEGEEEEWVTASDDSSAEEEGEEDVEKEEEGEEDVEKEEEGEVEEGEGKGEGKGEGSVTTKDSSQLRPDIGRLGVVNKKTYNIMYIAESECHGGILRVL